jgi:hypothetical protein
VTDVGGRLSIAYAVTLAADRVTLRLPKASDPDDFHPLTDRGRS